MRRSFALLKVLLCVGLSCMSLLLAVGYAAISGTIVITGTAKYEPGTIYITEVIQGGESFQKFGYRTLLGNHSFSKKNETCTVKVKVKNNSGIDQYFDTVVIMDKSADYDVSAVVTSANVKAQGTPLLNGNTETYTITFKSTAAGVELIDAQNLLRFTPDYDDLTQIAASSISERFLQILNGEIEPITVGDVDYNADDFLTEFKKNMNSADSGAYISNVSGAEPADQTIVDAIFGEFTSITLPGSEDPVPVKGLIKEQDVTGGGVAEMVLYVTADPLSKAGSSWNRNYVPVYAIVFEQIGGKWEQNAEMFVGTAPVTDYNGNTGTGSFSTDYWRSSDYNVEDEDAGFLGWGANGELDEAYAAYKQANP